jgi:hypothetical protein
MTLVQGLVQKRIRSSLLTRTNSDPEALNQRNGKRTYRIAI